MDAEKDVEKAATQETTELTDEQLGKVAGGGYDTVSFSIVTFGMGCLVED